MLFEGALQPVRAASQQVVASRKMVLDRPMSPPGQVTAAYLGENQIVAANGKGVPDVEKVQEGRSRAFPQDSKPDCIHMPLLILQVFFFPMPPYCTERSSISV